MSRSYADLTADEQRAYIVWKQKLGDTTLSDAEHKHCRDQIDRLLHSGAFGEVYEYRDRVEKLENAMEALNLAMVDIAGSELAPKLTGLSEVIGVQDDLKAAVSAIVSDIESIKWDGSNRDKVVKGIAGGQTLAEERLTALESQAASIRAKVDAIAETVSEAGGPMILGDRLASMDSSTKDIRSRLLALEQGEAEVAELGSDTAGVLREAAEAIKALKSRVMILEGYHDIQRKEITELSVAVHGTVEVPLSGSSIPALDPPSEETKKAFFEEIHEDTPPAGAFPFLDTEDSDHPHLTEARKLAGYPYRQLEEARKLAKTPIIDSGGPTVGKQWVPGDVPMTNSSEPKDRATDKGKNFMITADQVAAHFAAKARKDAEKTPSVDLSAEDQAELAAAAISGEKISPELAARLTGSREAEVEVEITDVKVTDPGFPVVKNCDPEKPVQVESEFTYEHKIDPVETAEGILGQPSPATRDDVVQATGEILEWTPEEIEAAKKQAAEAYVDILMGDEPTKDLDNPPPRPPAVEDVPQVTMSEEKLAAESADRHGPDLLPPAQPPKKRNRGRPKGSKDKAPRKRRAKKENSEEK
jgi:hypothetical protein